jgi:hypothetical protein
VSDEHKLDIEADEQDISSSAEVPTASPVSEPGTGAHLGLHREPRYCEGCGGRLPDMAGLNVPEGEGDVMLTADQAQRFRAAYLSLFSFWLMSQQQVGLASTISELGKVGL